MASPRIASAFAMTAPFCYVYLFRQQLKADESRPRATSRSMIQWEISTSATAIQPLVSLQESTSAPRIVRTSGASPNTDDVSA